MQLNQQNNDVNEAVDDNVRFEEEQNLNRCISQIDEIIARDRHSLTRPKDSAPLFGEAAVKWRQMIIKNIRDLEEARPNPYFGRVNFVNNETPDKIETYYFGKYHIPLDYVYNWTVPAGNLFYNPLDGGYTSKTGNAIKGTVQLKREFLIEETKLLQIYEPLLLPPRVKPELEEKTSLTRELSKSKGIELQDIVATIQSRQYEQIVAALQQVMIIQGVPGSGKSEVGLHRVAYLLSPFNELNLRIVPERVVVFGPSRAFLRYIARLLPSLDIHRVRQTTVREWLRSILSSPLKLERGDKLLEKQLRTTKGLENEKSIAKMKVSLQMAQILERRIRLLHEEFINSATDLFIRDKLVVNRSKVRKIIRESRSNPLNVQRNNILLHIEGYLRDNSEIGLGKSLPATTIDQFSRFWPELDYKDVYIQLLSDRSALITASKGSISEQQAAIFSRSLPTKSKTFRQEDLPALCHLDYLLNGREYGPKRRRAAPLFDHVVVDEAQDISPLEFLLMYRYSRNKSFTILGDIGQYLLEHRGIPNWREVKNMFTKESVRRWNARISYRATRELTTYANRILKIVAPNLPKAIPYKRHGEKPVLIRSKSYAEMISAIANDIRSIREKGVQTIAVLCKTTKEASKLQKRLIKEGVEDAVLLDKQLSGLARIVVASIYQTKGIEYDVVILTNARRKTYPGTTIHNRLLYIAVTRAAHILHIHWFGTLADILADPALLLKAKKTRGRKRVRNTKDLR